MKQKTNGQNTPFEMRNITEKVGGNLHIECIWQS